MYTHPASHYSASVNLKLHIILFGHFEKITHIALCRILCRGSEWKQGEEKKPIAIVHTGENEVEYGGGSDMVRGGKVWIYFRCTTDRTCY